MRIWGALWMASSWVVAPPHVDYAAESTSTVAQHVSSVVTSTTTAPATESAPLQHGISSWMTTLATAPSPPSKADVQLLRQAFAEFYGVNRDLDRSQELLSQAIDLWTAQPADERAGLYRVRGDCYTLLADATKAAADYDAAISLLKSPAAADRADPDELPSAVLGRARAIKSLGNALTPSQAQQAADDYQEYLKLTSREEWDTEQELIQDGATRNPYACWEWGTVLRQTGQWTKAGEAHVLASQAFLEIGDKARSVISLTDAGIDFAAAGNVEQATSLLTKVTAQTAGVESRDVALLQRVIAKEGEGRMALAALLWNDGNSKDGSRQKAEKILGDACVRLEQMQATNNKSSMGTAAISSATPSTGLRFSIDDTLPAAMDVSCYRFRNPAFLDQLGWPTDLQKKVIKLETLR